MEKRKKGGLKKRSNDGVERKRVQSASSVEQWIALQKTEEEGDGHRHYAVNGST